VFGAASVRSNLEGHPMLARIRRFIFGAPKDVKDPHAFHKLSLIAFLAWVGLGADGLSSSAYGPDEAFRALGEHTGLAFFLALATAATVFIISYGYSRIIEHFPGGGGGYVVASSLLGKKTGVVSGAALLVDYVLTITISISSGADAIFSFVPERFHWMRLPFAFLGLGILTLMNMRGVKESVSAIVPVFGLFLLTHAIVLVVAIGGHVGDLGVVTHEVSGNIGETARSLGTFGLLALFVRAYSMGGGTYTGIEAVSNGVGMMREPRVQTAKRTMVLMAVSLAITAGGILLSYLLVGAHAQEGKTMNAVLLERLASGWHIGGVHIGWGFVVTTLITEGALLFVAAQAGFLDGPRVMANMATDSWLPHRFAALSERLSMRNGVVLMAGAAAAALVYTRGNVSKLVVMYSINVFVTFSLSNLAMAKFWIQHRKEHEDWRRHLPAHLLALVLCVTILAITIFEKFLEGGWVTLVITAGLVGLCFAIKRHYGLVLVGLRQLDRDLPSPDEVELGAMRRIEKEVDAFEQGERNVEEHHGHTEPDAKDPVAVLFVGGYSGLGRHALLTMMRMFPGHFKGVVFVSVAVVDSESFKGQDQLAALEKRTRESLLRYELFAETLGLPAASALSIGTEIAVEAEKLGLEMIKRYPKALVVAGQLIFEEDTLWNRILHNETAFLIQQRLQHVGVPMIVLPVRIDLKQRKTVPAPRLTTAEGA
jgi:amino acid transporter